MDSWILESLEHQRRSKPWSNPQLYEPEVWVLCKAFRWLTVIYRRLTVISALRSYTISGLCPRGGRDDVPCKAYYQICISFLLLHLFFPLPKEIVFWIAN